LKATGIVRRIDELGRVVIPKEIRRTLRIREGDPLEIFTDRDGEVILKKYSPMGEMGEFAKQFAESVQKTVGHTVCVADRDAVLAASGGGRKEYLEQPISSQVESIMNQRRPLIVSSPSTGKAVPLLHSEEDGSAYSCQLIVPILSEGEVIGSVIVWDKEAHATLGETELKVAQTAANFLGHHMEQ